MSLIYGDPVCGKTCKTVSKERAKQYHNSINRADLILPEPDYSKVKKEDRLLVHNEWFNNQILHLLYKILR